MECKCSLAYRKRRNTRIYGTGEGKWWKMTTRNRPKALLSCEIKRELPLYTHSDVHLFRTKIQCFHTGGFTDIYIS
jgi:hypothetical protein